MNKYYIKQCIKFIAITFALGSPLFVLQFGNKLSGTSPFFKIICSIVSVCTPFVLFYILSTYKEKISELSYDISNLKEKISSNEDDYERQISYKNSEIEAIKSQHRKIFFDHTDELRESALRELTFYCQLNKYNNNVDESNKVNEWSKTYFFHIIYEIEHHIHLLFYLEDYLYLEYYSNIAVKLMLFVLLDHYICQNHIESGNLLLYKQKIFQRINPNNPNNNYEKKTLQIFEKQIKSFEKTNNISSIDDTLNVMCKTFLVILRDRLYIEDEDYEFSLEPDYSPLYTYESNAFFISITKKYLSTMVDILNYFCESEKGSLELKM